VTERRVNVGIRESYHKQLLELGEVTGHKVTALVDRAVKNMLETEAPVWRRAAKELEKKRRS